LGYSVRTRDVFNLQDQQPVSQLPDFRLETYLGKWEFAARHHMTASDAQTLSVAELLALGGPQAMDAFLSSSLGYTEPYGAPDLRAAIAGTYEACSAEDVLCFAGAEEGVYAFYRTLLDRDAHVIVVTPNYQSAETIPLSICEVTGVALDERNNWTLDIDQVAAAIRPTTRAMYINFPHNPTGKILERERFDALVSLCRRYGIYLLSDEVYRLIERDPALRLPQVSDVYERGVSLNVMSKAYGLPGLRIGWIACRDRALLDRMVRYKHYLSICNSGPSERLAVVALGASDAILSRTRSFAASGFGKVQAFLAEFGHLFESYVPDGGVVMYPRYKGDDGVEAFCKRLVEEAGVVLLPPSVYRSDLCATPTDRFRIGFGRAHVGEGLEAFRAHLLRNSY
jgi:aspartate/methionine/tyrosine aminotransferase